jgi:hypothetical protein
MITAITASTLTATMEVVRQRDDIGGTGITRQ